MISLVTITPMVTIEILFLNCKLPYHSSKMASNDKLIDYMLGFLFGVYAIRVANYVATDRSYFNQKWLKVLPMPEILSSVIICGLLITRK